MMNTVFVENQYLRRELCDFFRRFFIYPSRMISKTNKIIHSIDFVQGGFNDFSEVLRNKRETVVTAMTEMQSRLDEVESSLGANRLVLNDLQLEWKDKNFPHSPIMENTSLNNFLLFADWRIEYAKHLQGKDEWVKNIAFYLGCIKFINKLTTTYIWYRSPLLKNHYKKTCKHLQSLIDLERKDSFAIKKYLPFPTDEQKERFEFVAAQFDESVIEAEPQIKCLQEQCLCLEGIRKEILTKIASKLEGDGFVEFIATRMGELIYEQCADTDTRHKVSLDESGLLKGKLMKKFSASHQYIWEEAL